MNAPEAKYLGQHPALTAIRRFHSDLTAIRRELHQNPELGYEEVFTSELVAKELARVGVDEIHRGIGKTGVVGVIRGHSTSSGKTIGLRADMDALPMQEINDFEHRSKKPGMMHACGHDGHTTMLLGAARYLAQHRQFNGTVHLIFQPGEEGFAGAQAMIDDGLFTRFPCDQIFAMHNWPGLPPGIIAGRSGPMMAAADRIKITVHGKGGHGAHAYTTIDPVVIAAHIITALQTIVSRNVSAVEQAVVSVCAVQAGNPEAFSVIPSDVTMVGTVRTFKPEVQDMVEKRLKALVESTAIAFGATATVEYTRVYPAVINALEQTQFGMEVARELLGADKVIDNLDPSMGSEDFSFMQRVRPGAYFRLGQGMNAAGCFLHNTRYDFNDEVLPIGAAFFVRLAERAMPTSVTSN
jgi:amidohydrolase